MSGPNGKGASSTSADAPETHQNQHQDFANEGNASKALAAMRARAARCGCTLHELADGAYWVGGLNCSKAVPCLRAVGDFLRQIGRSA